MPWWSFTQQGIQDTPEIVSPTVTGQIFMYIGSGTPNGFLRCEGQSELISEYPDLYNAFDAAGVSFGVASEEEFIIPDLRDKFVVGHSSGVSSPVNISSIGNTGGLTSHTHNASSTHSHPAPDHHLLHNHDSHVHYLGDTSLDSLHTHTVNTTHVHSGSSYLTRQNNPVDSVAGFLQSDSGAPTPLRNAAGSTHSHTVSGQTGTVSPSTNVSGAPRNSAGTAITEYSSSTATGQSALSTLTSPDSSVHAYTAASIGNDHVPPYYTLAYIIKT